MAAAQRLAGAVVWYALVALRWGHATFVQRPVEFWLDTVLGNWEEAAKSAVRETFGALTRWINGVAAQVHRLHRLHRQAASIVAGSGMLAL